MGFFDDISSLMTEFNSFSDDIKGIKDDIVASIIEPASDIRDTVMTEISNVSGGDSGSANSK